MIADECTVSGHAWREPTAKERSLFDYMAANLRMTMTRICEREGCDHFQYKVDGPAHRPKDRR